MAEPRPTSITVICILGFIGAGLSVVAAVPILMATKALSLHFPSWYLPFLLVSALAGLTCMIGMWKMKKWGALGYTALAVANQGIMLSTHTWTILSLIIPGVVVAFALINLSKMD